MTTIFTEHKSNPRNYGNTELAYPISLKSILSNTDYIQFRVWKTAGTYEDKRITADNNPLAILSNDEKTQSYSRQPVEYNRAPNYPASIYMYMPEELSTTFKSDWEGKSIGETSQTLLQANVGDFNSASENLKSQLSKGAVEGAVKRFAGLLSKITGESALTLNEFTAAGAGVVTNPNVELLFKKHELRTFQLKFKMTPKNQTESYVIRNICDTFRRISLPYYGAVKEGHFNQLSGENFITVPDLCSVDFMHNGQNHNFLPRYNVCAVTDVSINYTPESRYATFGDGSPVATELKLSFTETKLQYNQTFYTHNQGNAE